MQISKQYTNRKWNWKAILYICACVCMCLWRRAANYAERKSKMLFQKLARKHVVISARWNVKLAVIKVKYLPNKSWYTIRCVFRVCQFRIFIGFIRFVSVTLCLFVRQINASRRRKCKQECGNHSICHSHHTSTQSTNSNWTTRVCRMLLTWWTHTHFLSSIWVSCGALHIPSSQNRCMNSI